MVPTRAAAICSAFFFLAGVAIAEKKTFNVVSFGEKVKVSVNGGVAVVMERSHPGQPLYTVDVDVSEDSFQYRYVQDGRPEDFKRNFPSDASATFNDFFGRIDTIKHLPQLGLPFKEEKSGQWTRGMGQVNPFNETYIPTLHITGKKSMKFFTSPPSLRAKDTFSAFFILQNETRLFEDVNMEASNKRFPKFAIKIFFAGNDEFYGRKVVKFRYGEEDPTFLREKLYTDLLVAVGAPVHQTHLIRVYAEGVPIGLYILQDDSADEKFIQTEFHAKEDVPSMGYPLDAGTGADFLWTDEPRYPKDWWDAFKPNPGGTNDRVVELSRALHNLDTTDAQAVAKFDMDWFDIDTFFKAMALEYLLGHWDSYWGLTTNFVVYDDPTESKAPNSYKFYFLDQDFEFSFGAHLNEEFNEFGNEFPKQSYKTLLDRTWAKIVDPLYDAKRRTMLDKLVSESAVTTKRFESILVKIVKHLLNPIGMFDRIDALAERYREELKWDRSLQRLRVCTSPKANDNKWTLEDLDWGVNGYPQGSTRGEERGIPWGLKPYIQERADAVAREFHFDYTNAALQPILLVPNNPDVVDVQPVKQAEPDLQMPAKTSEATPFHGEKNTILIAAALLVATFGMVSATG